MLVKDIVLDSVTHRLVDALETLQGELISVNVSNYFKKETSTVTSLAVPKTAIFVAVVDGLVLALDNDGVCVDRCLSRLLDGMILVDIQRLRGKPLFFSVSNGDSVTLDGVVEDCVFQTVTCRDEDAIFVHLFRFRRDAYWRVRGLVDAIGAAIGRN